MGTSGRLEKNRETEEKKGGKTSEKLWRNMVEPEGQKCETEKKLKNGFPLFLAFQIIVGYVAIPFYGIIV